MTFIFLYIWMLDNCLAYFSQNPQTRNSCINWWELCSLLSTCLSFSLDLFYLPDVWVCAIFRENQNQRKPSLRKVSYHSKTLLHRNQAQARLWFAIKNNKRNNKPFNNLGYSLISLMNIIYKQLSKAMRRLTINAIE